LYISQVLGSVIPSRGGQHSASDREVYYSRGIKINKTELMSVYFLSSWLWFGYDLKWPPRGHVFGSLVLRVMMLGCDVKHFRAGPSRKWLVHWGTIFMMDWLFIRILNAQEKVVTEVQAWSLASLFLFSFHYMIFSFSHLLPSCVQSAEILTRAVPLLFGHSNYQGELSKPLLLELPNLQVLHCSNGKWTTRTMFWNFQNYQ
jgi:hypothetical protein